MSNITKHIRRGYTLPAGLQQRLLALVSRHGLNATEIAEGAPISSNTVLAALRGNPCTERVIRVLLDRCDELERSIANGTRSRGRTFRGTAQAPERVEAPPAPPKSPVAPPAPPKESEKPSTTAVQRDEALDILETAFATMSTLLLTLGPDAAMALYHLGVAGRAVEKLRG